MNITKREAIKSLIISFLSTLITGVITSLNAGHFPTWPELKISLIAGAATFLAALLKFLTTDTVESAKTDLKESLPAGKQVTVTGQKDAVETDTK